MDEETCIRILILRVFSCRLAERGLGSDSMERRLYHGTARPVEATQRALGLSRPLGDGRLTDLLSQSSQAPLVVDVIPGRQTLEVDSRGFRPLDGNAADVRSPPGHVPEQIRQGTAQADQYIAPVPGRRDHRLTPPFESLEGTVHVGCGQCRRVGPDDDGRPGAIPPAAFEASQKARTEIARSLQGKGQPLERGVVRSDGPVTVEAQLDVAAVGEPAQESNLVRQEGPVEQEGLLGTKRRDESRLHPTQPRPFREQDQTFHDTVYSSGRRALMEKPIGLVLAGGQGRRMGRTKGDMTIGGRRLATRAANALAPVCRGVMISLEPGSPNSAPGFPAVEDAPPAGRGPLAGIQAAFEATEVADLLILACDYPNVGTPLLQRLLEAAAEEPEADLVIAVDGSDRDHPLVGLWRRVAAARVQEALAAKNYKVRNLVRDARVVRVGERKDEENLDDELLNLNVPADLDRL